MLRFVLSGAFALGLSGCAGLTPERLASVEAPLVTCATDPSGGCTYNLAPLRVLPQPVTIPRRPYKFFPTAEPLRFIDARGRPWTAPARTLTDGASIPRIFVSIVGDPTSETFINASAVHDAYCGVGNELGVNFHNGKWQDVHIMFYDGLVAGGTPDVTAKLMFAAVWLGGPRWNTHRGIEHVPVSRRQQAMRQTRTFVKSGDRSLRELIRFMEVQERRMLNEFPAPGRSERGSGGSAGLGSAGDDIYDDGATEQDAAAGLRL